MKDVAYIFPGQGAQYVGMGKDIYDNFQTARDVFKEANEVLGFDIASLCFNGPIDELTKTENCQPAIFTVSIAALRTVESVSSSLKPKFTAGLSLGEYAALVASGVLEFKDALILVRKRGEFMEDASKKFPGKMISIIGLSYDEVKRICEGSGTEIANMNCPEQIVVSGSLDSIEKAVSLAKDSGARKVVLLEVSGAFHSSLMNQAALRLGRELERVKILSPKIPLVNNVTASCDDSPEEIKRNLIRQISSATRWEDSIKFIANKGVNKFLEIGPGKVLKGLLRRIDSNLEVYNVESNEDIERLKLQCC